MSYKLKIDNITWNIILKQNIKDYIIFLLFFSTPFIFTWVYFLKLSYDSIIVILNNFNISTIFYIIYLILVSVFSFSFWLWISSLFYNDFIFDNEKGYFYNTKYKNRLDKLVWNKKFENKIIPLKQVDYLTLNKRDITSKHWAQTHSYVIYELNFILKNSSVINIVNYKSIDDAIDVSNLLKDRYWFKIIKN